MIDKCRATIIKNHLHKACDIFRSADTSAKEYAEMIKLCSDVEKFVVRCEV